ncbi:YbaB/EbfC family nucleoid-associated protein [Cellulomonas sp. DKR-3]|uniref:YbaB/EbfC family nucleoid-associated protein n=1 Tax=Cellulomonas fulva TaxID=2835530 RepID=A0ABS5U0K3_9CELL|nr:YbaB/EbfC family nucleoid-associated protein [Cellulomonas fulva]MBT0994930.1 YbaB/EbfC family nucleoid-associated protein [Cellulomonas fulva]
MGERAARSAEREDAGAAQRGAAGRAWVPSAVGARARVPGSDESADAVPRDPFGAPRVPPSALAEHVPEPAAEPGWSEPGWSEPDGSEAGRSEAARRVEAQVAAARERARQATALSAEVDALRASARSPRGEVTVEVDAGGRVTRVGFTERARAVPPAALGRAVEEAIRAAARECGRRAVALVERSAAGGPAMAEAMRADHDRRWA